MSEKLEQDAIEYLRANRKKLFDAYIADFEVLEPKIAYFTAGPSGAGKTEFAESLIGLEENLAHLDIDKMRTFFEPVGYDGSNSELFQKPASWAIQFLFEECTKKRDLSFILDSNFSRIQTAKENMEKLLKYEYRIEIFYVYNTPETCFLNTIAREIVTKRKVPIDVLIKSAINSRMTTSKIKEIYGDSVVVNLIDKRFDKIYTDINHNEFLELVPEDIEEKE